MSGTESTPPRHVPTLTDVVDWPAPAALQAECHTASPEPVSALPSEAQLVEQILGEVERQIDLMLEYRLREALMPVLARATENLIRDARGELASTLRDVVARAVAHEIARHRSR